MKYIKFFDEIDLQDIHLVGGKNASIGQMIQNLKEKNIRVPEGFAITSDAYWYVVKSNNLLSRMHSLMQQLSDLSDLSLLEKIGPQIRKLIINAELPKDLAKEIESAYNMLSKIYSKKEIDVAVRSSATAEDLPFASFAGQQETYLNIKGPDELLESVKKCMASLFTERAIVYRVQNKIDHFQVGISVGVQKMVRSDLASSGVAFSLDTETGFKNVVVINSSYGLGEAIVQGLLNPDEFYVLKETLIKGYKPIIKKYLGSKTIKIEYAKKGKSKTIEVPVDEKLRYKFSLTDNEILELSKMILIIEDYYSELKGSWAPVDVEWAKDGIDGKIYIVQSRPETVHSLHDEKNKLIKYHLTPHQNPKLITEGLSIGQKISHGRSRIIESINQVKEFNEGDILVTTMTDPDWVPIMKKAAGIVTNRGGRTCHAAIVSRELGIPAIVGTENGTELIKEGQAITIDCSKGSAGYVYDGIYSYDIETYTIKRKKKIPVELMLNIADPNRAFETSFLPVQGVGLARIEFIVNSTIKIHPMAIVNPEKIKDKKTLEEIYFISRTYDDLKDYFVEKLAEGIGTIVGAFYPRPVLVRLSDFKSNEYRDLLGGEYFEPIEENPMIGFRGASRYCSDRYAAAFALECAAIRKVFNIMGLNNMKVMIPFVRNVYEASCSLAALERHGIHKKNGYEIYMMCEIPSNVILMKEFAELFDGFSIGSNDLAQLTLGVDRDSAILGPLFDERDPAVLKIIEMAIKGAHKAGKTIGICGQAPSDFIDFAKFLIKHKIDSISLNPDSVLSFLAAIQ